MHDTQCSKSRISSLVSLDLKSIFDALTNQKYIFCLRKLFIAETQTHHGNPYFSLSKKWQLFGVIFVDNYLDNML